MNPELSDSLHDQDTNIASILAHSIVCSITDLFIDPYIGNWTQQFLHKRLSVGCGHDHIQDNLAHWFIGEIVGDYAAVPLVFAAQRLVPNFMDSASGAMEPILGAFFRNGSERAARNWARKNNVAVGSEAYQNQVEKIYKSEVHKFSQAGLWGASAFVINLCTQKFLGNDAPLWELAASKVTGAAVSTTLLMGTRGLFPGKAQGYDKFVGEKLVQPLENRINRVTQGNKNQSWIERAANKTAEISR